MTEYRKLKICGDEYVVTPIGVGETFEGYVTGLFENINRAYGDIRSSYARLDRELEQGIEVRNLPFIRPARRLDNPKRIEKITRSLRDRNWNFGIDEMYFGHLVADTLEAIVENLPEEYIKKMDEESRVQFTELKSAILEYNKIERKLISTEKSREFWADVGFQQEQEPIRIPFFATFPVMTSIQIGPDKATPEEVAETNSIKKRYDDEIKNLRSQSWSFNVGGITESALSIIKAINIDIDVDRGPAVKTLNTAITETQARLTEIQGLKGQCQKKLSEVEKDAEEQTKTSISR